MRIYRICSDMKDPTADRRYTGNLHDARLLAKLIAYSQTATVEEIDVTPDKDGLIRLLNGVPLCQGNAMRAWSISRRGALREMTQDELNELNEE